VLSLLEGMLKGLFLFLVLLHFNNTVQVHGSGPNFRIAIHFWFPKICCPAQDKIKLPNTSLARSTSISSSGTS
jgi:hypothetical protein